MKLRLLFAACVLAATGWMAGVASAWHADITASLDCNGLVTYTATAWQGPDSASRTNSDVRIAVSYNNGGTFTEVGHGAFTSSNGYSFSGSFSAGTATSA